MNHNKLKAALTKFKDITVKEQIIGEYTPEEIEEIWAVLQLPEGGAPPLNPEKSEEQKRLESESEEQKAEIERLKLELSLGASPLPDTATGNTPNSNLTIPAFKNGALEGEDFKQYQELVRGLDQRTSYDWAEYKAIGIFNTFEDQQTGEIVEGNILIGLRLVDTTPLKYTRMEARHLEYWMTGQRGRKVMGGLNAQIYDKGNNRANSRYYVLRQPA